MGDSCKLGLVGWCEGREVGEGAGRYDGLVGMFSGKDKPALGVSIERAFALLVDKYRRLTPAGQDKGEPHQTSDCLSRNLSPMYSSLLLILTFDKCLPHYANH